MKLKHVDLTEGCVYQDARVVKTKFSKSYATYSFVVGEEVRQIVAEWVRYLREVTLWGDDDPPFPATFVAPGSTLQFEAAGLAGAHWSTAAPIRTIFREAFERAGLPHFNPHSLRNTLTCLGLQRCQTAQDLKTWSQNVGHEQILTTLMNYGKVATNRQAEIIRGLGTARTSTQPNAEEIADAVARKLRGTGTTQSV